MGRIFCDNLHEYGQITTGKGIYRCATYSLEKNSQLQTNVNMGQKFRDKGIYI